MELKEFISSTIQQISEGIAEAKERCTQYGVIINPNITVGTNGDYYIPKHSEHVSGERRVQILDLDIAVTAQDSTENGVGGKIGVTMFGLGGNMKGSSINSQQNRVHFSIPICFPTTDIIKGK
jgi:hypothetical protein